ncbi:MAG: PAS domain-containing protein, partial [Sandaracinaceae bacterium]|nr:PAS domain-containing protein [Sandaracinaceae bacterium]
MSGPDVAGLRRRLTWLNAGRLFVATLLLGGTLVLRGEDKLGETTQSALLALVAVTFGLALAFAVGLARSSRLELLAGVQLAWDLVLITGVVYLLGGASSSFAFLYGVVILAAALTVGPRATQATAAASIVLYAVTSLALFSDWIEPPPDQDDLAFHVSDEALGLDLLRNIVGFVLVGLLAGSLSDRLRRTGGELLRAEAGAAGLSRLNADILSSMTSGLLTTDAGERIVLINRAGAQMLGASAEALIGRDWRSLLVLDDAAAVVERAEGTGVREDASRFPVGLSVSPLRDADGRVLGRLVLFQDLTELSVLREKAERAE